MRLLLSLIAASFLLLPAATAAAATVAVQGTEIVFTGDADSDRILVAGPVSTSRSPATYTFRDTNGTITPGAGCDDTEGIRCSLPGDQPATLIRVDLGAGMDLLDADEGSSTPLSVNGGEDNDVFSGGGGSDRLDGGPGADVLAGDESTLPAFGDNQVKVPDELFGGDGTDTVSYARHRSTGITASLDDQANDGQAGEGDNVHADVESLTGDFAAPNALTGDERPNSLLGGSLADTLTGAGGDDRVESGEGDDRLDGGPGLDAFDAGPGADAIAARDGIAEAIACGAGADSATADREDVPGTGDQACETLDVPPAPPAPPGPPPPTTIEPLHGSFGVTVSARALRPNSKGRVTVSLRCDATEPAACRGGLRLASVKRVRIGAKRRIFSLGARSFSVAPGKTARITFTLSKANRAALRRLKKVTLLARVIEQGPQPRDTQRSVTLRR